MHLYSSQSMQLASIMSNFISRSSSASTLLTWRYLVIWTRRKQKDCRLSWCAVTGKIIASHPRRYKTSSRENISCSCTIKSGLIKTNTMMRPLCMRAAWNLSGSAQMCRNRKPLLYLRQRFNFKTDTLILISGQNMRTIVFSDFAKFQLKRH